MHSEQTGILKENVNPLNGQNQIVSLRGVAPSTPTKLGKATSDQTLTDNEIMANLISEALLKDPINIFGIIALLRTDPASKIKRNTQFSRLHENFKDVSEHSDEIMAAIARLSKVNVHEFLENSYALKTALTLNISVQQFIFSAIYKYLREVNGSYWLNQFVVLDLVNKIESLSQQIIQGQQIDHSERANLLKSFVIAVTTQKVHEKTGVFTSKETEQTVLVPMGRDGSTLHESTTVEQCKLVVFQAKQQTEIIANQLVDGVYTNTANDIEKILKEVEKVEQAIDEMDINDREKETIQKGIADINNTVQSARAMYNTKPIITLPTTETAPMLTGGASIFKDLSNTSTETSLRIDNGI